MEKLYFPQKFTYPWASMEISAVKRIFIPTDAETLNFEE